MPLIPGRAFAAFLFDMDGTILSSIRSAERVWAIWAREHGLDVETFLPTIHGKRSLETVRDLGLPGIDPVVESERITRAEIEDVAGIDPIDGAAAFLNGLPADRWAIVTSAPRELALRRIDAAGLPPPPLMIAAENVERGKPAPDCFLLAASQLGVVAADCLVFEDSPAGLLAAEAAGMAAVAITAIHAAPAESQAVPARDYLELAVMLRSDGMLSL